MMHIHDHINSLLNRAHECGEFNQHPMKRFFLTRLQTLLCIPLEGIAAAYALGHTGAALSGAGKKMGASGLRVLFPKSEALLQESHKETQVKNTLITLCCRIAGFASTLFIGIFSPELNFRLHKKLGLAVDNLVQKKEQALRLKLETDLKAAQIERQRSERFAKFQAAQKAADEAEALQQMIDSRLAELLLYRKVRRG
jgi:hypothetical protein